MPGKHQAGDRQRLYSIVIHDIIEGAKHVFDEELKKWPTDWYLIADEEYNHQDGHHIHIFIRYSNGISWKKVLKTLQDLNQGSRVHIRYGRSEFNACKKYLCNPDKEKNIDANVIENVSKLTLAEKYPDEVRQCNKCAVLFYAASPFLTGILAGKFRPTHCFKCTGQPQSFKEYLKNLQAGESSELISQEIVSS